MIDYHGGYYLGFLEGPTPEFTLREFDDWLKQDCRGMVHVNGGFPPQRFTHSSITGICALDRIALQTGENAFYQFREEHDGVELDEEMVRERAEFLFNFQTLVQRLYTLAENEKFYVYEGAVWEYFKRLYEDILEEIYGDQANAGSPVKPGVSDDSVSTDDSS